MKAIALSFVGFLCVLFLFFFSCSEAPLEISSDSAPNTDSSGIQANESVSTAAASPASTPSSSGKKTSSPTSVIDLGDIPKLEDLPESFRYSDEEWQAMMEKYRMEPAIEIDYANAEVVNCTNCAFLVEGVILYPPFYIQQTDTEAFVNGYRFYPSKRMYEYRQSDEYKKYKNLSPAEIKEMIHKAKSEDMPPCVQQASLIDRYVHRYDDTTLSPDHLIKHITTELKKEGIVVKDCYYNDKKDYFFSFSSATCRKFSTGLHHPGNDAIYVPSKKYATSDIITEVHHPISLFKSLSQDNRFFYLSCNHSCSSWWKYMDTFYRAKCILDLNFDPRIKYFMLLNTITFVEESRGIIANYQ